VSRPRKCPPPHPVPAPAPCPKRPESHGKAVAPVVPRRPGLWLLSDHLR
jgi:hypothetical protein